MRKIGFTLGLFLLVSLFAAGAYAAGHTEGKKKNEAGVYAGVVTEIDLKGNRMVVTKNNTDLAMVFNTSMANAGSGYKDMNEVKNGDQVEVKFKAKVGNIYALTVAKGKKNSEIEKTVANASHPPHP